MIEPYDRYSAGIASSQHQVGRPSTEPKEPGMQDRVRELTSYLCELDEVQANTREKLFGSVPANPAENSAKSSHEPSIEEKIATACRHAACLVSEARSINSRL